MNPARCPWAIKFGVTLHTRCSQLEGHDRTLHHGRGLVEFPYQVIEWLAGDRREYRSDRDDRHAWEEPA